MMKTVFPSLSSQEQSHMYNHFDTGRKDFITLKDFTTQINVHVTDRAFDC
jgi:hypothetical protein